ncbi:glycosyltransferase [Exiguobacterium sp. TNDT2]|uniref:glycosyltransferase n=1 Tax=Exiguobacterium sp. TNDT2 TaxID=2233531 RepID=UPI000DEF6E38|nr:glycosyltransferase [Exiguobacterium sp. TNDT2]
MNEQKLRILVYGDVNLNLIDGSAIWLTSVVHMLNQDPHIEVDVLLKRSIVKPEVTASIKQLDRVRFIDVFTIDSEKQDEPYYEKKVLQPDEAAQLIHELVQTHHYDMAFIRGFQLAYELTSYEETMKKTWTYITDFTHDQSEASQEELARLKQIAGLSARMLCQTAEMKQYFETFLETPRPFLILNPMISNMRDEEPSFKRQQKRLVYTGKFAPLWYSAEILDAFKRLRVRMPDVELKVAGDKFNQDPNNPNFRKEVTARLQHDEGIDWLKGIPRADVETLIASSDLGLSWRHPELDASLELSTKLLEYGALGKPVLLNRNPMHESLLGTSYPLFVNSEDEFVDKVELAFTHPAIYRDAATRLYNMAKYYTFSNTYARLRDAIWEMRPTTILFAGHDLKFIRMFMDRFEQNPDYRVLVDEWEGHKIHDVNHSKACLAEADIIFCEWGLGNAVWYSNHKLPHQRLIVRIHRQEKETPFPNEYNLDNIDRIILVSPYMLEEMSRLFHIPRHKMTMIYNAVDGAKLQKPKQTDALPFHLGMIGINPKLKRPDLALDVLEKLLAQDDRYHLFFKGHHPSEVYWIAKREEERTYYEAFLARIEQAPLKGHVHFDGHGSDVDEWLQKIGFILSVSDLESFHLSPAEGMASGTYPLIRHWTGSETIYPDELLVEEPLDVVDTILSYKNQPSRLMEDAAAYQQYALKHFAIEQLFPKLERIVIGESSTTLS